MLDIRTMYIAAAMTCFIVAIALFFFQPRQSRRYGVLQWILGWTFQGACWLLFGLRGVVWDFLSIVVANTLLTASYSFLFAAIRQFQGRSYNWGILLFPPAATFIFFWYFFVYADNLSYRIIFISILLILQISSIVWVLLRDTPVQAGRSYWLIVIAFLVEDVVFIHRLLETQMLSYEHLSVLQATIFRNVSTTARLGVVLLSSIGFTFMIREREEEALRQAHARLEWLARLPNENPSPVLRVSADGDSLYCNPAAMALEGWKCEIDRPLPDPVLTLVRKAMVEDKEVRQDMDLGERTYSIAVTSFPEEGYANVYGRDITERKRAEKTLRIKDFELSEAQRIAHIGSWHWEAKTDITLGSDELLRIYGFDPATQTMPNFREQRGRCYPVADWERVNEAVQRTVDMGLGYEFDVQAIRNGELIWITTRGEAVRENDGRIVGLRGTVQDITERKQAEEALRNAKDKMEERVKERTYELYEESLYARSLIEASLDPLVTISVDGKITDVNRASEEVTGVSREQLIGSDFLDYFTEPEKARAGYEMVFRQGFVRDYPLELKHRDGHVTPVLYNASVYRDDTGRNMGVFAAARDITERKQAEAAQRRLASQLVMAEERERKRIAGVLHDDIAQILASARMRLDMLEDIPSDQVHRVKEAKALLLQSLQETRALMNDLGNPVLFDLGLKAACETLAKQLMERNPVRIRCDIQDAFKDLNTNMKTILYQVVRELLNNVAKHSQAQNAHVTIDAGNEHYRVQVSDDGVGFDPRTLGAPTTEGGFGLYSIRERLMAVDGSLRIESAQGTGTVVTAILAATLN
jgi:PAS domain S-box-containing protein